MTSITFPKVLSVNSFPCVKGSNRRHPCRNRFYCKSFLLVPERSHTFYPHKKKQVGSGFWVQQLWMTHLKAIKSVLLYKSHDVFLVLPRPRPALDSSIFHLKLWLHNRRINDPLFSKWSKTFPGSFVRWVFSSSLCYTVKTHQPVLLKHYSVTASAVDTRAELALRLKI